jgi:anti-sigma factor RsiW
MRHGAGSTACDQAGQLISLRLDGELSQFEATALDRHLAGCGACRALADELAGIARLLREAPPVEAETEFVAPPSRPVHGRLVGRALGAVALAGAAAAAAVVAFSPFGQTPSYSAEPAFRSAQEQINYVRTEQQRIEPAHEVDVAPVPPQVTARSL